MIKSVVLLNLGGPDKKGDVRQFLFNLFYDRAIINLANPLRYFLARLISSKRAPIAQEIYEKIGGGSPLLELTKKQAEALKSELEKRDNKTDWRLHICMRYWHPMATEVIKNVVADRADEVILLPLYPQYSTTTTGSSFKQWRAIKTKKICCYPDNEKFISAHVELIKKAMAEVKGKYRILFSAHGLPEKIIKSGDPYQMHVETTVAAITKQLGDVDYVTCYQSRVGPLKWIKPATDEEIIRAGSEKLSLIIVPVAFVSEHSETLVELDIEYKKLAHESGVVDYIRVPALGTNPLFISALADIIMQNNGRKICSNTHICGSNGCI